VLMQVTITDLQRHTGEIINDLEEGPIVICQRGRPAAVIVTVEDYEQMERALAELEARTVREIVQVGLGSLRAGRTSPESAVAHRIRAARPQK
jgi:prevent-host-death family protein